MSLVGAKTGVHLPHSQTVPSSMTRAIAVKQGKEVKYPHQQNYLSEAELNLALKGDRSLGIWILVERAVTASLMQSVLKAIASQADLLIVDYLQLMSSGDQKLDNAYQETLRVSKIATELKRVARAINLPVIAIRC